MLEALPGAPARYVQLPLPAYRHVPGLTPHPLTHPGGHSYDQAVLPPSAACFELPQSWADCREYLYGVDLFNRAYLWEAHEAWEIPWKVVGSDTLCGRYLQGLIQVSAALLRQHLDTPQGARRLLAKAVAHFHAVEAWMLAEGKRDYMGLELLQWRRSAQARLSPGVAAFPFLHLAMESPPRRRPG